ncbi:MAG: hypothetical protein NVS4B6_15450 [Mycobacterium sp.]
MPVECYSTPRLQIDSSMYGSGKTTLCEQLSHLCGEGILIGSAGSPATMVRILHASSPDLPTTLIVDECDRNLRPDRPGVDDLLSVLNSGYKRGAYRPVSVPDGNGWRVERMSTFAPVVLSGNAPMLPDDTRSRCIRILLVPDLHDTVDDTDWEVIQPDADRLQQRIARWADQVRVDVARMVVPLTPGCKGRNKEKWRPLMRVAQAAGGDWPATVTRLIERDLERQRREREDGYEAIPPAMRLIRHLWEIWGLEDGPLYRIAFVPTKELLSALPIHVPEDWSALNYKGKALTAKALGNMLGQVAHVHSDYQSTDHLGPKGYWFKDLQPAWAVLGISPPVSDASQDPKAPKAPQDRKDTEVSEDAEDAEDENQAGEPLGHAPTIRTSDSSTVAARCASRSGTSEGIGTVTDFRPVAEFTG